MRRVLWLPAVIALLIMTAAGQAQVKKRDAPAAVAPVTIAGVRYEALPFGKARGLDQNGGYVVAIDAGSGRELWVAKVYTTREDAGPEGDKQDVFITSLRRGHDGKALVIETERGERYEFDLTSQLSRRL